MKFYENSLLTWEEPMQESSSEQVEHCIDNETSMLLGIAMCMNYEPKTESSVSTGQRRGWFMPNNFDVTIARVEAFHSYAFKYKRSKKGLMLVMDTPGEVWFL